MLNRLFIIIGVVAILAIGAAFVVPAFVPWEQYRDRLAAIAGEMVGAPVRIEGDVSFTLLPQPRLTFAGVSAGPEDAPVLTVGEVEAEFSLIDFLRDRYNVTRLVLTAPSIRLGIDADGALQAGAMHVPAGAGNVSVASAAIAGGTVSVNDARSGQSWRAEAIDGELRMEALRGPYAFQATGDFEGKRYSARLTTGEMTEGGAGTVSLSLHPLDDRFTLAAEGSIAPGAVPAFTGTMTWRQPPPRAAGDAPADVGRGDLVMTSKVSATPSRVLLTDYIVVPDENRGATRLQGAAEIALGAEVSFNAVVSGGVMALPPRDATAEQVVEPYEIVRLLNDLPLPADPGIPGTIGLDVAEVDLRAFALRNVRLDARAHPGGWTVQRLTGTLPGDATISFAGEIDSSTGKPEFDGEFTLRTARLDALSSTWRKLADGNPLFGVPGGVSARLTLVGETLSVSNGRLDLDGATVPFSAQAGLGSNRDLRLTAHLGSLDAAASATLAAFLPDLGEDPAFAVTFPKGEFDVSAEAITLAGLPARNLAARGTWDGGVLVVDRLAADDLGGARFTAALTAFGTVARPELSGTADIAVESATAPAVAWLHSALGTSGAVTDFLAGAFPAELDLVLDAPSGDGAQSLKLDGELAGTSVTASARLAAGFLRAPSGSFALELDARSADGTRLAEQFGLSGVPLFAEGAEGHLVARVEGNAANSLETTIRLSSGSDEIGFSGNVVVTDPAAFSGRGTLKAKLEDPTALAEFAGVPGIWLPAVSASASVIFDGSDAIRLEGIEGVSGALPFTGQLAVSRQGANRTVNGALDLSGVDLEGLIEAVAGPAALIEGTGIWPDGPLDAGAEERPTTGRVALTAPAFTAAGREVGKDFAVDLDWDAGTARFRNGRMAIGDGELRFDLALCCAGPLPAKRVTGRYTVTGVDLGDLAPSAVANAMSGKLDASGRIDTTGESIADMIGAMTGDGTFSLDNLEIARFDPSAPQAVVGLENIIDMQPEEVIGVVEDRLDDAPFVSPETTGSYTIAGGVLRSPNLAIAGQGGRLFGSGSIRLADLGLSGSYALTPTQDADGSDPAGGQIVARLAGTMLAPERRFDLTALVDGIMVKAYEAEVARLEKLRAEDEARRAAEAAEQARIAAEQERLAAEQEAARQAEEEAAAQAAADEAARQAAEDEAAQRAAEEALRNRPVDIGFGN